MKEIRPVFTKQVDVEYQIYSLFIAVFGLFRLSEILAMIKMIFFNRIFFFKCNGFGLFDSLIEETKPVFMEKYQFKYRNKGMFQPS